MCQHFQLLIPALTCSALLDRSDCMSSKHLTRFSFFLAHCHLHTAQPNVFGWDPYREDHLLLFKSDVSLGGVHHWTLKIGTVFDTLHFFAPMALLRLKCTGIVCSSRFHAKTEVGGASAGQAGPPTCVCVLMLCQFQFFLSCMAMDCLILNCLGHGVPFSHFCKAADIDVLLGWYLCLEHMIPRTSHRKGSRYKGTNLGNSAEDESIYDGTEGSKLPWRAWQASLLGVVVLSFLSVSKVAILWCYVWLCPNSTMLYNAPTLAAVSRPESARHERGCGHSTT